VRVLCYVQHLSGAGHYVRTHAIACGLARSHQVLLVDGGRPVPRLASPPALAPLPLPRIGHHAGALVALDDPRPLARVLDERIERLTAAARAHAPDVVTIEHYPWSKWALEAETLALVEAARDANPGVRVVCSLRDVAPPTRYEAVGEPAFVRRVLDRLARHFDALLVHADPAFTRLEEHFAGAADLPVPLAYTGFVRTALPAGAPPAPAGRYAVLSVGGDGPDPLTAVATEAFRRLSDAGELGDLRLIVFGALFAEPGALSALAAACRHDAITVLPFSPEFPAWLARSELSLSQAGYNTCVDLLAARVPAVLCAHPSRSDQAFRAERMRTHGLAVVTGGEPSADTLADAIRRARASDRPEHRFDLGGVEQTARLLETLHRDRTLSPPPMLGRAAPRVAS
jgi:predicted glycosyltransferase